MTNLHLQPVKALSIDALLAIDRLNSWVRSPQYRGRQINGPKALVYHLKRQAISHARELRVSDERSVFVEVECRDCSGTGRYTNWDGFTYDHCRACGNSGEVKLYFLETSIPAGGRVIRWHSPSSQAGGGFSFQDAVQVTDWQPNTNGRDLTVAEVCRDLLTAEAAYPKPLVTGIRYQHDDDTGVDENRYRLYLGESEKRCCLCGREEGEMYRFHQTAWRVSWTAHVCPVCNALHRDIFARLPVVPPAALTADPDIQRWIMAHSIHAQPLPRPVSKPVEIDDPFADM
jgi:hypothetical protein